MLVYPQSSQLRNPGSQLTRRLVFHSEGGAKNEVQKVSTGLALHRINRLNTETAHKKSPASKAGLFL